MDPRQGEAPGLSLEEKHAIDSLLELAGTGHYYAMLGVSIDAEVQHIRRTYYALSRVWHPDRFYRRDLGEYKGRIEAVFAALTKAYSTLTNPATRDQYDDEHAELLAAPAPGAPPMLFQDGETTGDGQDVAVHEVAIGPRRLARQQAPVAAPPPEKPRERKKRHRPIPGLDKVREQIAQQLSKGKRYHQQALAAVEQGNWAEAASKIYLATRFNPENAEYQKLLAEYEPKGRNQIAQNSIHAAESAESYHNIKAAIYHYEKACKANPPVGLPFYRLAKLKIREEEDEREILRLYRLAADKEPSHVAYRLALADQYLKCGLPANAKREYQAVLQLQPGNADAKAGIKKVRS